MRLRNNRRELSKTILIKIFIEKTQRSRATTMVTFLKPRCQDERNEDIRRSAENISSRLTSQNLIVWENIRFFFFTISFWSCWKISSKSSYYNITDEPNPLKMNCFCPRERRTKGFHEAFMASQSFLLLILLFFSFSPFFSQSF